MTFPDWEITEDALEYSAVKLFVQSARRVQPDFAVTDDNLTHLARICRQVEGIPLGILLAAAWTETLSLQEIADEISRSIDFLSTEWRDVPPRQRSIRAVFDYSWNLLSTDERNVFKCLSVFHGGFSREAAQQVAGASLRTLAALVNKSVLRREPGGRYEIHELLRQYAAEKLDEPETTLMHSRHLDYFLKLTEQTETQLYGSQRRAWVGQLAAERGNLRAALEWSLRADPLADMGTQSAANDLEPRSTSDNSSNSNSIAWSLFEAGNMSWYQSDNYKRATTLFQESLLLFQETENNLGVSATLCMLGQIAKFENDNMRAEMLYKRCLALKKDLTSESTRLSSIVLCLADLASLAQALKNPERAARLIGVVEAVIDSDAAIDAPTNMFATRNLVTLRTQLDNANFAESWAEGRAMTLDQAVAYALET